MNNSSFQLTSLLDKNQEKELKTFNLNFGPQHPAAHGVLRLILQLIGELIDKNDIHIGLLHRGSEKLIEDKIYLHSLPYFDRMDYVSMLIQEHAYCLAIERLLNTVNYSSTFVQIRTLYDELTRILNHMLAIACHALDVGSMSSIFWMFEEREKIMEFYERVCGARMHAAFYRPNEINLVFFSNSLLYDISIFVKNCFITLNEVHNVLTFNKIWKQRLVDVGVYNLEICLKNGLTGVMARGSGIKRDIRLDTYDTYANYSYLNFKSYIGNFGDSYDRFLLRMLEMVESLNIINQCLSKLGFLKKKTIINKKKKNKYSPNLLNYLNKNNYILDQIIQPYSKMENLIKHFKYWSEGFLINAGFSYASVESPKGEFGVSLFADNSAKPYRCKVRSPAYHHLQVLPKLSKGHFLADLVTLIGTIDIVFGEVDR